MYNTVSPPPISGILQPKPQRLLSLDILRGLIMILLAGESCLLYQSMQESTAQTVFSGTVNQFFHHPWHGLRFWDLVQPAFMFIAGSSLYISSGRKFENGVSWRENLKHILLRSLKLFICGLALHCIYSGKLVWELWNVLTQLSVTTVIAYLIIRKSYWWQAGFSVFLLILTEVLYRTMEVPGFNQPFIEHHNFGAYADLLLMGKVNNDGWVAINFIPTAAHTIWGMLAGKLLISHKNPLLKVGYCLIAGLVCLLIGYSLDVSAVTPIIKRISTSSFVFVSGGWVFLMLALVYWIADIKQFKRYAWIFTVVGLNSIFIYLFFETIGIQWLNAAVRLFVNGFLSSVSSAYSIMLISSSLTLLAEWYLCYWLYQRKIFFKL